MKIGVLGHCFVGWNGGVDFIRGLVMNLLACERQAPQDIVVLLPWRGPGEVLPPFYGEFANEFGPSVEVVLVRQTEEAVKLALKKHSIEILLPSYNVLAPWVGVPWIGYLYDFQHKYLPQLFPAEERDRRDAEFLAMVQSAESVIVNSHAVAADAQRFFPDMKARIVTLPFSASPNAAWLPLGEGIASRYKITSRYMILCNQFWVHKDHWTAFQAFAKIAHDVPDIDLVCTGHTNDDRLPGYFAGLKDVLRDLGIDHRVHILGLVPKDDQIGLLKNAVALIQPTLFEGGPGGGAVHDAVALGVPALVSDIPVNRELPDATVTFFKVGDPDSLSQAMRDLLARPEPAKVDWDVLVRDGKERRRHYGDVLMNAIDETLSKWKIHTERDVLEETI